MYSLPISVTLAALTMASAASTEPMRPLVSTSPSASCAMDDEEANRSPVGPAMLRFARDDSSSPLSGADCCGDRRVLSGERSCGAAHGDADGHAQPPKRAARDAGRHHV